MARNHRQVERVEVGVGVSDSALALLHRARPQSVYLEPSFVSSSHAPLRSWPLGDEC